MADENKIPIVLRTQVYLDDPEYFCNKSWTLSFNVNTKSWISFHSYIPNWYIAENNFFYSGINGCCDEFDFIAGPIVATPSTTTTTTMFVPTTTTTSTTVTVNCTVEGVVRATDCLLEGTGVITIPPVCQRPTGLQTINFTTGYNIINPPSTVVSTGSQIDACNAITYINTTPILDYSENIILVQAVSTTINQTVYDGTTGTDCTVIPDGWYFTDETSSNDTVFNVVGGIIVEIVNCNPVTTTTTTTTVIPCYSFTVTKTTVGTVTVSYIDCSGNPATTSVGLPSPGGPSEVTICGESVNTPSGVTTRNNGPC